MHQIYEQSACCAAVSETLDVAEGACKPSAEGRAAFDTKLTVLRAQVVAARRASQTFLDPHDYGQLATRDAFSPAAGRGGLRHTRSGLCRCLRRQAAVLQSDTPPRDHRISDPMKFEERAMKAQVAFSEHGTFCVVNWGHQTFGIGFEICQLGKIFTRHQHTLALVGSVCCPKKPDR